MTPTTNTTNNHHECSNEQWQQPKIITTVTLCRGRQRRLGGQRSKEGWRPTSCTTRRCFENSWLVQILNILANKFRIWTRRTQHHSCTARHCTKIPKQWYTRPSCRCSSSTMFCDHKFFHLLSSTTSNIVQITYWAELSLKGIEHQADSGRRPSSQGR